MVLGTYSKELRAECWADTGTPLAIAALFTVAKRWKQSQNRLTDEQTNKIWSVHTGIVFSLKRKGVLTHSTVGMNLEDSMLHEAIQSQDDKICMIPLIMGAQRSQIHRDKVEWWFPGAGERGSNESVRQCRPFFPGGDPLEEGMATLSNILAWRIPWTEEPGSLQSMESQ